MSTTEQRSITADVAAIAGMLDDLADRTTATPPEALRAIARALEAMVGIGAPLAAHGRYRRLSADAGGLGPAVVGSAARQEAEDMAVAGQARACRCLWRDRRDHDWLVGFEARDTIGIVEVFDYFDTQSRSEFDAGEIPLHELVDFVAQHNWVDPVAVRHLAAHLQDCFGRPAVSELDRLRVDLDDLRASLATEVRTRRLVVIDEDGFHAGVHLPEEGT